MLKRLDPIKIDEKAERELDLANWAWNSHYWVEYYPGYYKCEWCGKRSYSEQGISAIYPLCERNMALIRFLKQQESKKDGQV